MKNSCTRSGSVSARQTCAREPSTTVDTCAAISVICVPPARGPTWGTRRWTRRNLARHLGGGAEDSAFGTAPVSHGGSGWAQWVINGYALVFGVLIVTG